MAKAKVFLQNFPNSWACFKFATKICNGLFLGRFLILKILFIALGLSRQAPMPKTVSVGKIITPPDLSVLMAVLSLFI